jgi:hypothetical protein
MSARSYYKLDVQGIVYLVDPTTSLAYTYDLENPTEIGKIVWTDLKEAPEINLREDWKEALASKLASTPALSQ